MFQKLRSVWRSFQKKRFSYTPLVDVAISAEAIRHNLRTFSRFAPVAPVLKSNAYGHGLIEVAGIVQSEDIPFLCVDSYFEALILRNEGISKPILILGYTPTETMIESQLSGLAFGIVNMESLQEICAQATKPVSVHIKFDTGMHRHGLDPLELDEVLDALQRNTNIRIEGVYSHLADADTYDSAHARAQITVWNTLVTSIKEKCPVTHYHLSATSGSALHQHINANVLRLGIGLYGINASVQPLQLAPALKLTSRITSLRTVKKGEAVGYNATFRAAREMRIATIPVGYYEGLDRRLSNKGTMTVAGTRCPIVGRVSMNISSIDVSALPAAIVGSAVVVIDNDPFAPNSIEKMAQECATIPYELLVHIPGHLRRTVY